jgi:hypothetical protein
MGTDRRQYAGESTNSNEVVHPGNRSSPRVGTNGRSSYCSGSNCMDETVSALARWPPDRDLHGPWTGNPERDGHPALTIRTRPRTLRFFGATTGYIPVSVHVSYPCSRRRCESPLFHRYYESRNGMDWPAFEFDRPARAAYPVSRRIEYNYEKVCVDVGHGAGSIVGHPRLR